MRLGLSQRVEGAVSTAMQRVLPTNRLGQTRILLLGTVVEAKQIVAGQG